MSTEYLLLALRLVTIVVLLGFLIAVFMVLWRDYHAMAASVSGGKQRRGRLVVIRSANGAVEVGVSFPLLPLTSLGRGPTNTIVLQDNFCSQEHALVTWRGDQWWLEDRDSSNGTLLNDELVVEPVVVSSGDVIGIGQVRLKIELD